ncbi:MAG: uncharacterized membrane protein (DUF373 family) [Patiriisocius sp.]|jgi:uncharacterized membrane protein (DUF373 family)
MERTVPFLNGCISFVAFITALTLVIYMVIAFVSGVFDVALLMFDTVFLEPAERQAIFNILNADFLHNIAVLLILMKAYRILVEYMKFHHIDIKFMVEIGIIACILELLFNFKQYTEDMQVVLAAMCVAFLAIYAFRYDTLAKASKDAQKAHEALQRKK